MPGFGSLLAGRFSGYLEAALSLGGMALTLLFGARFFYWYLKNWSRFRAGGVDLGDLWAVAKWPLLGIGLFAAGWFWSLLTGLQILASAKRTHETGVPPKLR